MIKKAGIDLVPRSAAGTAAPAAKTEEAPTKATIVEETKDAVTETAEVVTDKVADVKETVAETVETVTEKAIDTKDAVVETVTDKVDEAKEAVTETVEVASDKVEEVKTDAVAAVAATATAAKAAIDHSAGEKIYKSSCFACHDSGVAGSPKLGDKAAWAPRIATGNDQLYASSINGKGAMPAKGGNTSIADDDIKAAVDYMVSKSQ
ncbi:UNVERIFIED_CONTAM: hypothetical protein GTU68_053606 [Idotea baltica]|nr:hypothetical protein [Idotea baltica]